MRFKHLWASAALAGALCTTGTAHAVTELNASVWFPDSHPLTKIGYIEWAKNVAKASNGDIKINVFTGTSLLPPTAHFSGLRDGVAHRLPKVLWDGMQDDMKPVIAAACTSVLLVATALLLVQLWVRRLSIRRKMAL